MPWRPSIGELIIIHPAQDNNPPVGKIIEVIETPYGHHWMMALVNGEIKRFSTLHCDPLEQVHQTKYYLNNFQTGEIVTTTAEKIKQLNLPSDTKVNISYSEGTDVFVHNETEIETALENTSTIAELVGAILKPNLNVRTTWGGCPLSHLRDLDFLADYDRQGWFEDYLIEMINDNFYDVELVDHSIEKYDHKRGYCTLTAELYTTTGDIITAHGNFPGWKVTIETNHGDLILT